MNNGFLIVNKEEGITSFNVIEKAREKLSIEKIGHIGTLDPFASGLLVLTVGSYTRLLFLFDNLKKEYIARGVFGAETDTEDKTGKVIKIGDTNNSITREYLEKIIATKFTGEIEQTPPMYSAKHINGKRAYQLAREGIIFELPKQKIVVEKIELVSFNYPYFEIKLSVSKGTYIRSIIRDIGRETKHLAYTESLKRTAIGDITLDKHAVNNISKDNMLHITDIFQTLDIIKIDNEQIKKRLLVGDKNTVADYNIKQKYIVFIDSQNNNTLAVIHKDYRGFNRYIYVSPFQNSKEINNTINL